MLFQPLITMDEQVIKMSPCKRQTIGSMAIYLDVRLTTLSKANKENGGMDEGFFDHTLLLLIENLG